MANLDNSWVVDIERERDNVNTSSELDKWTRHSIYMVPAFIKDLNPTAYKPQIISFGPYHYGDEKLWPMEIHKRRALIQFLERAQKPLKDFMSALEEVVGVLMDSYQSLDERWTREREDLLRLMLFDGCFMLEVLRFLKDYRSGYRGGYAWNDPIFSRHGMSYIMLHITMDMLRIENQLPLLVLKKLVAVETGQAPDDREMNQLVLNFVAQPPVPSGVGRGLHPLDLFHKSRLPDPGDGKQDHKGCTEEVPCGTLLVEKGIRFRKKMSKKTNRMLDISFANGVLSLPTLIVVDDTECEFLNLMAFERLHVDAGNQITSYVFFMDTMVDSAEDVTLLVSKGIIHNSIGTDKAVAKLFNSLGKYVSPDPGSSPSKVLGSVDKYYKRGWIKCRAKTTHFFCKSLWANTVAAFVLLLVLTLLQTVYTLLQYHKRR